MQSIKNPAHPFVGTSDCLKLPEIASLLGVSRATAYNLAKSDGFPRLTIGRRVVVPRKAFEEWVRANTVTTTQGA